MELDWTLGLVLLGMGATAALVVRSLNGSNTAARPKRASSEPNPQEATPPEPDVEPAPNPEPAPSLEPAPEPADLAPQKAGAPRPLGPSSPDDGRGEPQLITEILTRIAHQSEETVDFLDWLAEESPEALSAFESDRSLSRASLREDSQDYWRHAEEPVDDVSLDHRELSLEGYGFVVNDWMRSRAAWLERREDLDVLERTTKLAVDQVRVMRLVLEAMELLRLDPELRVWEVPEDALIGTLVYVVAVDGAISERDVAFLNGVFKKDLSADDYVRMYGGSERSHGRPDATIDFLESVGWANSVTSGYVNPVFFDLTMLAIAAGDGHDGEKLARREEVLDAGREVMEPYVFQAKLASSRLAGSEGETEMALAQSRIDALRRGVPGVFRQRY
ncbi:hypothetical protein [Aquisalimonas asiatica]|uniref:Uncharacterized protein n=1 Tax=Aquisalimonas asiatica TaxID=406100 RepID=A0A1H8VC93_9GAMM|nr:hypothetical protein [Aquisalimonas asiatica]SEP12478.1 hypothetical protein SAMN04488052_11112 [Aquisalimonas asiatica]